MSNLAVPIEKNGQRVGEVDSPAVSSFYSTVDCHVVITEVGVARNAICGMKAHIVRDPVGCVTLITVVLLCDVVRELGLIEVGSAAITIPD